MEITPINETLANHRFFKPLPDELADQFAGCSEFVAFTEGQQLLTEDEPADCFYALRSGRVAVGVHTPNRGFVTIETLHSGDILGWSWLFPPYRWHFDAIALKPVTAIKLHAPCIRTFLDEHPEVGYQLAIGIATVMEDRLESARMRLLNLYGDVDASRH
ncbi:MAG: cyclic nucleotide-binding domain-containing protein [Actinomycetes bacterium]